MIVEEVLTRCGYRCDLCLAYRPNVEANPANRQALSDGWHRYFGFRIPAQEILCDGCWVVDGRLIDTSCPVRPCVMERSLRHCAECPEYACGRLADRLVSYEEVEDRAGEPISTTDRARFIAPYENLRRLEALREVLR